jgi:hypothetical protein
MYQKFTVMEIVENSFLLSPSLHVIIQFHFCHHPVSFLSYPHIIPLISTSTHCFSIMFLLSCLFPFSCFLSYLLFHVSHLYPNIIPLLCQALMLQPPKIICEFTQSHHLCHLTQSTVLHIVVGLFETVLLHQ